MNCDHKPSRMWHSYWVLMFRFVGFWVLRKNEVIIWRPFPSPSAKNSDTASFTPFLSAGAVAAKPKTEAELEEAAVERWARLADLALGNEMLPPVTTKNKKKRVA